MVFCKNMVITFTTVKFMSMCKDVYNEECTYSNCTEREIVIGLQKVPTTSYNKIVKTLVGVLSMFGSVVVCDLKIDYPTTLGINVMAMKGTRERGKWKSIELPAVSYQIYYGINSKIPKEWRITLPS